MTHAERAALEPAVPPGVVLAWQPHEDSRFVRLQAHPCPLLRMEGKTAICTVHAVRPFNCRRFGCFRDDCSAPLDLEAVPVMLMTNRSLRRQYARMQNRAQVWALDHGWMAP